MGICSEKVIQAITSTTSGTRDSIQQEGWRSCSILKELHILDYEELDLEIPTISIVGSVIKCQGMNN
ncbi:hypothetical protein MKX01_042611 [Papaver californicum]|nr:hypothetical protein MKX01_042611 [Papaver californicum]